VDAQPGTPRSVSSATQDAQAVTAMEPKKIRIPSRQIRCIGTSENEMGASSARVNILRSVYFDRTANRTLRS
jgi:hypothetical protein